MSDPPLEHAVIDALAANPLVDADDIAVLVSGGRATLYGSVRTLFEYTEVLLTALHVPRVELIEDELHLVAAGVGGDGRCPGVDTI